MTSIKSLLENVLTYGNWADYTTKLLKEQETLDTLKNWMYKEIPTRTQRQPRVQIKKHLKITEMPEILTGKIRQLYTLFKHSFYFGLLQQSISVNKTESWGTYWENFHSTFMHYKMLDMLFSPQNLAIYLRQLPLVEQQQFGTNILEIELKYIRFGILTQTSIFINKVDSFMIAQLHRARSNNRHLFVFPEFNLGILAQTNSDELLTVLDQIDKQKQVYLFNYRIFSSHAKSNSIQSSLEPYFLDIKLELMHSLKTFLPQVFKIYESKKLIKVKISEYSELNQLLTDLLTELRTGDEITLEEATKVVQEEMTVTGLSEEEISAYIKKVVMSLSHFEYIRLKQAFRRADTNVDSMLANLDALFEEWEKGPKI